MMLFRKNKVNNSISHHIKNDDFEFIQNDEFNLIDLGEQEFLVKKNLDNQENNFASIPELEVNKKYLKKPDNTIYSMNNLSYPCDIKYVNRKYQREKFKRFKKIKKTKRILKIIILICCILLLFIIYKIINWQKDNINTKQQIDEINKEVEVEEVKTETLTIEEKQLSNEYFDFQNINMINVDFNNLLKRNPDTVGWIKVEGTSINYPFVQTINNDYYLTHSFNKKNNDAGWVFLDYRNDINDLSKNTVLYGHGRLNNTMFGSLKKVVKNSWYSNNKNHVIRISTPKENSIWQVFSTYTIGPESYYITTDFSNIQLYEDFINVLKNRSVYDYNVDITSNDYILTLSSCYDDTKRVVLHAKLVSNVKK